MDAAAAVYVAAKDVETHGLTRMHPGVWTWNKTDYIIRSVWLHACDASKSELRQAAAYVTIGIIFNDL